MRPGLEPASASASRGQNESRAHVREGRFPTVSGPELFSFPWPGPGNSEGPVDPEGWVEVAEPGSPKEVGADVETDLLVASPWPGPGDSEA